jgi:hypothetical protein
MSWVNGQASQSRSWTWLLQPLRPGRAEVGAVQVPGVGSAPAIPIDVVAGRVGQPPQQQQRSYDPFDGMIQRQQMPEARLFVEAKTNRGTLYVGEPLVLTYYLYTQTSISGLQFVDAPQFTGFWAEDLEQSGQPRGEPVNVEGINYRRFPCSPSCSTRRGRAASRCRLRS